MGESTLVRRVAVIAASAAAAGGLVAAILGVTLADAIVSGADDRRIREEAAAVLAEVTPLTDHAFSRALAEERRELAAAGLRFALYRDAVFVGGDATVARTVEGCSTLASARTRTCAVASASWTAVVASDDPIRLGTSAKVAIVLGAALLAAALGAASSGWIAGWAIGPLARLRLRLGDAPIEAPVDLGEDEGVREVDALRSSLRALLARRDEALRGARLFAAGAAHELRTPLTTISGELELLCEEALPPEVRDRLGSVRASTRHVVGLLDRLLLLARVGAAETIRSDAVDLAELVEDVALGLGPEAAARIVVARRSPGLVRGDESLLRVLVENLVGNALVHAAPAMVRIVVDEQGERVVLDVIDEGPGVAPGERARVLEPFERGETTEAGTGLGLALVARIARAHAGEARFVDATCGAHVRVCFPRWAPRERAPAARVTRRS